MSDALIYFREALDKFIYENQGANFMAVQQADQLPDKKRQLQPGPLS